MATTTTNYGFDIPQSTDLVKDGATAIATLGQDIDTAMFTALGTNKAGMVLLNTTSFSAVASASLATDTFTSTYKNYRILLTLTSGSTNDALRIRGRTAGSDNSTSNYFTAWSGAQSGNGSDVNGNANAETRWLTGWSPSSFGSATFVLDVFGPKETEKTTIQFQSLRNVSATLVYSMAGSHYFNGTTSFDSLSFIPDAGNITGYYSVYGVNA